MKKFSSVLVLLILPILFIILCLIFKGAKGELYFSNYYDPSFPYLMNALNLAQLEGFGVGHIDHPGTTVQAIGGVIIYFMKLLQEGNTDITANVFHRPQFYISNINFIFNILNAIALFILGLVTFKKLKSIQAAFILQLTPFFSISIYTRIMNVSPEPVLVFTMLMLIAITISYISEVNLDSKSILKYVLGFAVICGFGLATKISFFPVLIIPLILIKRLSYKSLFCLITLAAFFLFVIPALSTEHILQFKNWIRKLILFSGKYGGGEKNIIDSSNFFTNLSTIFVKEPVFGFSFILVSVTFFLSLIPEFRSKIRLNKYHTLLIAIFAAMSIQTFIVFKHFELHYLIPGYMLAIPGLFAVNSIYNDLFPKFFRHKWYFYLLALFVLCSVIQTILYLNLRSSLTNTRNASHEFLNYVSENSGDSTILISSYGVSNKEFALYLGALYSGSQKTNYYTILKKMFPDIYHWDMWSKNFNHIDNIDIIRDRLIKTKSFLFECNNDKVLDQFLKLIKELTQSPNITSKKVFSVSTGEAVYEIRLE